VNVSEELFPPRNMDCWVSLLLLGVADTDCRSREVDMLHGVL